MKNLLIVIALCLPLAAFAGNKKQKKADADTAAWRYEIEYATNNANNNVVVTVWSYSKKPEIAAEQSKKNAVHGLVFKGVPAKDRYIGRKPLVSSYDTNTAFFDEFFANGGEYMRFVTLSGTPQVIKVSKKEYKVGVPATVMIDDLRKFLEQKGVARSLGAGF